MGIMDSNFSYNDASTANPYQVVQPQSGIRAVQQMLPQLGDGGTPFLDWIGVPKTAYAQEYTQPPPTTPPPTGQVQQLPSTGTNYSFGDPNNPDLSNPVKQTDFNNYQQSSGPSAQDQLRSGISSNWDNYISSLNDQMGGLNTSRTSNENIANTSYDQGKADLGLQLGQNTATVDTQQARSLKDISSNISSAFQAGNNYLGSTGVGNPTGANMYSYALTQMGSKQRGDVMRQVADQKSNLTNIYNNEVTRLGSEKTTRMNQIADWFANAQQSIKTAQAQGQLQKGQDLNNLNQNLYSQGVQMLQQVNTNFTNQQNALQTWAMNNSKSIGELQSKMQQIASVAPQTSSLNGNMQSNSSGLFNPSVAYDQTKKQNSLF